MTRRIGIDARFFGPRDKGPGRYTENLVKNLEKIDRENQYFIFLKKNRWNDYQLANANFKKVLVSKYIFWSKRIKKYNLDLMHFTFYKVPFFYKKRFILTVHDLTWQRFHIFNPLKEFIYKIGFVRALRRAQKIIAISNYIKEDIVRTNKIDPDKIKVIYEGVS